MIAYPYGIADWNAVVPIAVVGLAALAVLVLDVFARPYLPRALALVLALVGTVVAGWACALQYHQHLAAFGGAFIAGGFTTVFEEIALIAAAGTLALYGRLGRDDRISGIVALVLWATMGAMLMAGAANLMSVFLGLELLSLALYCLCGISDRPAAREAALKYLILSSTASGFLLYGTALLFGATGSIALSALTAPQLGGDPLVWIGLALFFVGLAFKLGLVPFHVWVPDVYEGAPLPVTAFMSVATKAGALAVFARIAYAALPAGAAGAMLVPLWELAAVSMVVGNLGMLAQTDLKRLLGYSSIAQIGYVVTALAGTSAMGMRYAIYYLVAYTAMNLGAFAVAAALSGEREEGARLESYRGLAYRRPYLAAAMMLFMLALAGIPPTAGFLGKALILAAAVGSGYAWLGVILVAGTAISLFAYAKVIYAMYARTDDRAAEGVRPFVPLAWASVLACAAVLLVMTFYPLAPSNVLPLVR